MANCALMAVLIEYISVVVPNATLEQRWPGGVESYAAAVPNRTFCTDGVLTRVGFMHPDDVKMFARSLESWGIAGHDGNLFRDYAVVDEVRFKPEWCTWLVTIDEPEAMWASLAGTEPGEYVAPAWWSPHERSRRWDEAALLIDDSDPSIAVALDMENGDVRFIGRSYSDEVRARKISQEATEALDGGESGEALNLYKMAFELGWENSWDLYLAGVAASRMEKHLEAIGYYQASLRLAPENEWALANLAGELVEIGEADEAVVAGYAAVAIDPSDHIAWFHIARAELLRGDRAAAKQTGELALALSESERGKTVASPVNTWLRRNGLLG